MGFEDSLGEQEVQALGRSMNEASLTAFVLFLSVS